MNTRTLAQRLHLCMLLCIRLATVNKLPHLLTVYNFHENGSVNTGVLPCLFWGNIERVKWQRAWICEIRRCFTMCYCVLVRP